jgi:hypothetical protein
MRVWEDALGQWWWPSEDKGVSVHRVRVSIYQGPEAFLFVNVILAAHAAIIACNA